ncbi:MAG: hypothetical protein CSA23_07990 [Deltaproteobacteria bacterium]|nr:MAG: hypothetical protein CSA23_07990 [Deltaproteobacteria bacterium]
MTPNTYSDRNYAAAGFYNGTIFQRVIAGFMIQGGVFDTSLQQKSTWEPIVNEEDGNRDVEGWDLSGGWPQNSPPSLKK